jgi:hypothetical protein
LIIVRVPAKATNFLQRLNFKLSRLPDETHCTLDFLSGGSEFSVEDPLELLEYKRAGYKGKLPAPSPPQEF